MPARMDYSSSGIILLASSSEWSSFSEDALMSMTSHHSHASRNSRGRMALDWKPHLHPLSAYFVPSSPDYEYGGCMKLQSPQICLRWFQHHGGLDAEHHYRPGDSCYVSPGIAPRTTASVALHPRALGRPGPPRTTAARSLEFFRVMYFGDTEGVRYKVPGVLLG